jgi:hypothetical protein
VIPVVVGSSPISHPKKSKGLEYLLKAFFFDFLKGFEVMGVMESA